MFEFKKIFIILFSQFVFISVFAHKRHDSPNFAHEHHKPSVAHEHHESSALAHEHHESCEIASQDPAAKIFSEFHAALEGQNHKHGARELVSTLSTWDGLKSWAKTFNLKRVGQDSCRLFYMRSADPQFREHAANFAFLFPLSHATEVLSGPVLASLSTYMDWPNSVTGLLGAIGVTISIPGLDPICILLYSAYSFKPFQRWTTRTRTATISAISYLGNLTGINRALQATQSAWQLNRTNRLAGNTRLTTDGRLNTFRGNEPLFEFLLDDNFSITQLNLNKESWRKLTLREFKNIVRYYPMNVRSALNDIYASVQHMSDFPFYVQSIENLAVKSEVLSEHPAHNEDTHSSARENFESIFDTSIYFYANAVRLNTFKKCMDILARESINDSDSKTRSRGIWGKT